MCLACWYVASHAKTLHTKLLTTWRYYYTLLFDIAKLKIIWATYQICASVDWALDISFPSPFAELQQLLSY